MSEFAGAIASLSSGGGDASSSSDSGSAPTDSPTVGTSTDSSSPASGDSGTATLAPEGTEDAQAPAEAGQSQQAISGPPKTVPYARLSEVVAERNTLREQMQALQWAQGIPTQAAPYLAQLWQGLQADPIGTLVSEAEALMASGHADAQQALRSAAARWLRQGRQPAAPEAPAEIDLTPTLQSEDGQPVYTAQQVQALVAKQVQAQIEALQEKLQPLEQDVQERKVQAMVTEIKAKAKAQADEIRTYPHFDAHKQEIVALLKADPKLSPEKAWMKVVLPKLTLAEQKAAVQNLQVKAQAGAVAPGRAPVSGTPKRPSSFKEAMLQVQQEMSAR